MKIAFKTALVIGALILSPLQAQAYETTSYARVISSKPVWTVQTVSKPIVEQSCVHSVSDNHNDLLGDIIIGGLIGSVIGNAVSDVHGAGALGTSIGALIAADSHAQNASGVRCVSNSTISETTRKVISHYEVKVRHDNKIITFETDTPFKRHSLVKVRANERYTLLN